MASAGNILVLGSAGFIGSAIVARLNGEGRTVYALGRSESRAGGDGVIRLRGSIEDSGLLREVLAECTQIVYSASITTPGTSARQPSLEVIGNLLPLARLLECAWDFPGRHLVYLSSGGTVFGDDARDADESTPLRPRSYYGAGKVAAEALLHACAQTTDWKTTVLRPTNPYGPGQEMAKAFAIVPTLFQRALDGGTFQVWGNGTSVRDYCFIDDLVAAIMASLSATGTARHRVYNVSSGETASVLEIIHLCEQASGRPIRVVLVPARGVDVPHVSPSHAALTEATGWMPRTTLRDGLAHTWAWMSRSTRASSA